MLSSSQFFKKYQRIYPNDLHLKHELWYFLLKRYITKEIITYIQKTKKQTICIGDIGGGYGYDDILVKEIMQGIDPNIHISIDVIDPTVNFYNDVHKLQESDIRKQHQINYIEESLLDIDIEKYKEKYDIIISSEVIEHLRTSEQEIFFSNFNKTLKTGGLLLVTCPNGSSILKMLAGIRQWKRKSNDVFLSEFNHRYAHIGIPTLFQVMGLYARKGFVLQKITPTTVMSGIRLTRKNRIVNIILNALPYANLFLSTSNLFVGEKKEELDIKQRYNTLKG